MNSLVSIIVPIYKVPEHYLRACIESLKNQTLNKIEIVLVDDGSPDKCGEICDEYARRDERIRVIHQKNSGPSRARNTGLFAATGEWITFVDGDDWIEPDMCSILYNATLEQNVEMVFCRIIKEYANSSIPYTSEFEDMKVFTGDECKQLQVKTLDFNAHIASPCAKLISRTFLLDNKIFFDDVLRQGAEDLEFILRMFYKFNRIRFVNKLLYHYSYNDNSITAFSTEENSIQVLNCFKKIREFIEVCENRECLVPMFNNRIIHVLLTAAVSGYFNPHYKDSYHNRVMKYKKYLEHTLVVNALKYAKNEELSLTKKITLFFIKIKVFLPVLIIANIRKKSLLKA